MAPLVAKGKVVVGVSGGEFGVRGHITAYGLENGERLWRWHNTEPDEEVGITERFKAPYDRLSGEDLGVGVESRLPRDQQPGNLEPLPKAREWANIWSLGAMARDLDTGELVWAYQYTPHSMLDHDSTQEHILVDWQCRRLTFSPELPWRTPEISWVSLWRSILAA